MKIDDVRKTVSNPKPLYFAAGLGDAAVEALKDAPAHLNTLSARATVVATDVAGKVAGTAESLQSRVSLGQIDPKALREQFGQIDPKALREQLGQLDPKALRARISELPEPDLRAVREKAQTLLLQQVGWALEVAGKAVETYDEYSERGKGVVDRVVYGRGTAVEVVDVEDATAGPAERVVVEHVTVVEAEEAPKADAPKTDAPKTQAPATEAPKTEAPKTEAKTESPKAEAPKPEAKPQAAAPAEQANGQKAAPKKPAAPRRPAPRGK